jgi:hypothetical protein
MNLQIFSPERVIDKGVDGALTDLSRPIHVEGPDNHRRQAELLVVGICQVLTGKLAHRISPPRFANCARGDSIRLAHAVCVSPKYLAGRECYYALAATLRMGRLEEV